MIITIDGPSGTGKTTVAKMVAERLGIDYFDTGAMYRLVTYLVLQRRISLLDHVELEKVLDFFVKNFEIKAGRYFIQGRDLTLEIRSQEVNSAVSDVSAITLVRESLWKIQRAFAEKGDAVFEGRDMGTVVFPQAEIKIFLTASPEVRARRRMNEMLSKHPELTEEQVLKDLEQRDRKDSTRKLAPLCCPDDAYQVDTSGLLIDEVVEKVIQYKAARV